MNLKKIGFIVNERETINTFINDLLHINKRIVDRNIFLSNLKYSKKRKNNEIIKSLRVFARPRIK
jgi:hypothetical protein